MWTDGVDRRLELIANKRCTRLLGDSEGIRTWQRVVVLNMSVISNKRDFIGLELARANAKYGSMVYD